MSPDWRQIVFWLINFSFRFFNEEEIFWLRFLSAKKKIEKRIS